MLELLIKGSSNKEIAREPVNSIKTMEAHRARLVKILDVKSLAELVQLAFEHRQYLTTA